MKNAKQRFSKFNIECYKNNKVDGEFYRVEKIYRESEVSRKAPEDAERIENNQQKLLQGRG
jgi:hypothetical protein